VIIAEKTVVEVVTEASEKMTDPNYSAVMVGGYVQTQPQVVKYISSFVDELGGSEQVVHVIFHAALIATCFQRGNGRSVREISFDELNHVADKDREVALKEEQPAILEYIVQNVDNKAAQKVLMLLALAMEWVS
jgi:hypothetical protein